MSARTLNQPSNSGEVTYELKMAGEGREKKRRMTLQRLGEDVESRSTCYKVIYDDLLVLKIPPEPVTDFNQYLRNVKQESLIASRLGPEIPCLIPTLRAILKNVPEFQNDRGLTHDAYEDEVIRKLQHSPGLHRCLKIRGTFVLFMSLSTHMFFDQAIMRMHQDEMRLRVAVADGCDSMGDIAAFETAFGKGKEDLFFALTQLQAAYVRAMDRLLEQHGVENDKISDDRKKRWMFEQLAGRPVTQGGTALSAGFLMDQKRVGNEVLSSRKKEIRAFVQLIKSDIRKTGHDRNRGIAGGMISSIIKLLRHLRRKKAAIRDLKPDNMFLAGSSDDPDLLLSSADHYRLGLIDLETSANTANIKSPEQPILAGTPFFMTPSHLFENSLLKTVFNDVQRTLYLQDWFAAIGIIYNVVTGNTLFERTSKLLPEVVRIRAKAEMIHDPLENVFKNASWVFWHRAASEFKATMDESHSILKGIPLDLGMGEREMLAKETATCNCLVQKQIERIVFGQAFLTAEKARKNMERASSAQIEATIRKWQKAADGASHKSKATKSEILDFLHGARHLAECRERLTESHLLFASSTSNITAWQLMLALFRCVSVFMYRTEWTVRKHPEPI